MQTTAGTDVKMHILKRDTSFVSNVAWNATGTLLPLGAAFFSIPILLDSAGLVKFGLLTIAWTIVGYFSLFDFGIGKALTKLVSERIDSECEHEIPALINISIVLMMVLGAFTGFSLWISGHYISYELLSIPDSIRSDTTKTFGILAITIPFVLLGVTLTGILESFSDFKIIGIIRVPSGIFNYAGPAVISSYFSQELSDLASVLLIGRLISTSLLFVACIRRVPEFSSALTIQAVNTELLKSLLSFGGWMTISNVVGPLLLHSGRFLIAILLSAEAVSYFATPYEVVVRLLLIPAIFITVFFPYLSKTNNLSLNTAYISYIKMSCLIGMIMAPICLIGFYYSEQFLSMWISQDFSHESFYIAQILFIGVFFNSLGHVSQSYIHSLGRPDATAKLHLVELTFYITYLWYLIDMYQLEGAAYAWVLRVFISTIALWLIAKNIYTNKL